MTVTKQEFKEAIMVIDIGRCTCTRIEVSGNTSKQISCSGMTEFCYPHITYIDGERKNAYINEQISLLPLKERNSKVSID